MTYDEILAQFADKDLDIREQSLTVHDGLIYGHRIAIRKDLPTQKAKSCVLAEELGHYYTTVGNILDQSCISNRKQELHARMWGYDYLIGLTGLVSAAKSGCCNIYEIAEYLDVTEEYLLEAINAYRNKYGVGKAIDNYWITFEPNLQLYEMFIINNS